MAGVRPPARFAKSRLELYPVKPGERFGRIYRRAASAIPGAAPLRAARVLKLIAVAGLAAVLNDLAVELVPPDPIP